MSRSKSISDEKLLDDLMGALTDYGPSGLSFGKASKVVALSASTLVQRFKSRDDMIEAILLRAWDHLDQATAALDSTASVDPPGAIEILMKLSAADDAEYQFTDGLLLLREDIRNPVLSKRGVEWGSRLVDVVGRRICFDEHRATQLGWQMVSIWQGALVWSAYHENGPSPLMVSQLLQDWCRSVGVIVE